MIRRGSIHTMAARGNYTGKPRPVIILQNSAVELQSVIVIPLTTFNDGAPEIRVPIPPSEANGLSSLSFAMCDKISAVPVGNLGREIGSITREQSREIDIAVQFLLSETDDLGL